MFWTLMSVAMCAGLATRLIFYSDAHRQDSRWYWRVMLFLVTIYAGLQVIDFLYDPGASTSPWMALFNLALFFGSFLMRPEYLPWNGYHDPTIQAHRAVRDVASRIRYGFRRSRLYSGQARSQGGKHRPHRS